MKALSLIAGLALSLLAVAPVRAAELPERDADGDLQYVGQSLPSGTEDSQPHIFSFPSDEELYAVAEYLDVGVDMVMTLWDTDKYHDFFKAVYPLAEQWLELQPCPNATVTVIVIIKRH